MIEAHEEVWYNKRVPHYAISGSNRKGSPRPVQEAPLPGANHFPTCHGVENGDSKPEASSAPRSLRLFDLLQGGAGTRILRQGSAQGVQENLQGEKALGRIIY